MSKQGINYSQQNDLLQFTLFKQTYTRNQRKTIVRYKGQKFKKQMTININHLIFYLKNRTLIYSRKRKSRQHIMPYSKSIRKFQASQCPWHQSMSTVYNLEKQQTNSSIRTRHVNKEAWICLVTNMDVGETVITRRRIIIS